MFFISYRIIRIEYISNIFNRKYFSHLFSQFVHNFVKCYHKCFCFILSNNLL